MENKLQIIPGQEGLNGQVIWQDFALLQGGQVHALYALSLRNVLEGPFSLCHDQLSSLSLLFTAESLFFFMAAKKELLLT